MILGAVTVFFASLAGIVGLFSMKLWEEERERTLAPGLRSAADSLAARMKTLLISAEMFLSQLPSLTMYMTARSLAFCATALARLMHGAAEGAHGLADLVSHKHNFERRETRSDFLKQVSEHPMRNPNGSNVGGQKNGNGSPVTVTPEAIPMESTVVPGRKSKRGKLIRDVDARR